MLFISSYNHNLTLPSALHKWQQSDSKAQRYMPLFITIRPNEKLKISKLLILVTSNWDL